MSFLQWSFSTPTEIVPVGLFILHTELKTSTFFQSQEEGRDGGGSQTDQGGD